MLILSNSHIDNKKFLIFIVFHFHFYNSIHVNSFTYGFDNKTPKFGKSLCVGINKEKIPYSLVAFLSNASLMQHLIFFTKMHSFLMQLFAQSIKWVSKIYFLLPVIAISCWSRNYNTNLRFDFADHAKYDKKKWFFLTFIIEMILVVQMITDATIQCVMSFIQVSKCHVFHKHLDS